MPRVVVGVALSTPRTKDMPRAALGVDLATPRVGWGGWRDQTIRRGSRILAVGV
jgi:hypothetical protein